MFDINSAIGHWPFRKIPNQTATELRSMLESRGISGAAVANINGLFYKNCHDANLELATEIDKHKDFFCGVATLNPRYAAWDRDIVACKQKLGFKALRLVPQYHGYRLGDPESIEIAKAAVELNLPIMIPLRVVDLRQRHILDTNRSVMFDEVCALLDAVPECTVIYTESARRQAGHELSSKYPGLYFEMSRLPSVMGQFIAKLVKSIGADRILFGTGAPFKSISSALLKLEHADIDETAREMISESNARKLLGL